MDIVFAELCDTPAFISNKKYEPKNIEKYHSQLKSGYVKFAALHEQERQEAIKTNREKQYAFENKICMLCGATLRKVPNWDFYGCPNYKDGRKHTTFNVNFKNNWWIPTVSKDWVTEIIREEGLKDLVRASEAYEYFMSIGLDDLKYKEEGKSTSDYIYNLVEAKKRSYDQEQIMLQELKKIYPNVIYQRCIRYQLKGGKMRYCIPDYICGSEFEVLIADAKLDHPDTQQLDLYISCIKFIMDKAGDERPINGATLMYYENYSPYMKNKYPVYYYNDSSLNTIPHE